MELGVKGAGRRSGAELDLPAAHAQVLGRIWGRSGWRILLYLSQANRRPAERAGGSSPEERDNETENVEQLLLSPNTETWYQHRHYERRSLSNPSVARSTRWACLGSEAWHRGPEQRQARPALWSKSREREDFLSGFSGRRSRRRH